VLALAVGAALIDCGSSAPSHPCNVPLEGGVLSAGTISFVARSATAFEYTEPSDPKSIFAEVVISAALDACAEDRAAEQSVSTADMTLLSLQIHYAHVGTFCVDGIPSPTCAWARMLVRPAGTQPGKGPSTYTDATGTMTVTAVDLDHVGGTYDLQFGTGEKLTGAFDAPTCNVGACVSTP